MGWRRWCAPGRTGFSAVLLARRRAVVRTRLRMIVRTRRRAMLPDAPPRDPPDAPSRDARGALVFLDLDNLKPLNDRHGHEAGDAALRATARLLRATAAPGDIAARFGGDEFILWIDGADAAAAIARARALLDGAALHDNDRAPRFSLGLAAWDPASGEGVDRLLARADAALYEAKRHGRGGWRLAGVRP